MYVVVVVKEGRKEPSKQASKPSSSSSFTLLSLSLFIPKCTLHC